MIFTWRLATDLPPIQQGPLGPVDIAPQNLYDRATAKCSIPTILIRIPDKKKFENGRSPRYPRKQYIAPSKEARRLTAQLKKDKHASINQRRLLISFVFVTNCILDPEPLIILVSAVWNRCCVCNLDPHLLARTKKT